MAGTLSAGVNSLILKLDTPYDTIRLSDIRDDLIKVKVWCSTTALFTPSDANKVFDGLSLSIVISNLTAGTALIPGTPYYVKYALISEIEPDNYTVSSELTATPTAAIAPKNSVAYLYQWSTSQPSNPNGNSTYTWSTGANSSYTGGNSWSTTIGSNPGTALLQLWTASKAVTAAGDAITTTVDWSTGFSVASISQNGAFGQPGGPGGTGASGYNTTTVRIYKTGPTIPNPGPSGTSTYTWASSSFTPTPGGWTLEPPSSSTGLEGQTLWAAQVTITDVATNPTTTINWTTAAIVAISYYGTQGSTSTTPGPQGASARVAYAVTTTTPSGTTSQGINYAISGDNLPPTGTWFGGVTWLSNAPATALIEGQFLYQVDGLYNPTTTQTTWFGVPYLSNLKVGSLSALSVNTGTLTVTGTISVTGDTANGVLIKTDGIYIYKDSLVRVKLGNI